MKPPTSILKTYGELWGLLEAWGLSPVGFEAMAPGKRPPTSEQAALLGNAAIAFLSDTHTAVRDHCRAHRGVNISLLSSQWARTADLLPLALLYSDLLVVFSGVPRPYGTQFIDGVRRGGVILSDVPMWFRDTIRLRPAIEAGDVLSLPRNYYDAKPGTHRTSWILGDFHFAEVPDDTNASLEPFSVFFDVLRPAAFDLVNSGHSLRSWRDQLLSCFASPRELSVATALSIDLPFLRGADLATVCRIKEEYAGAFRRFRDELRGRVLQAQQFQGDDTSVADLSRHLSEEWIKPAMAEVEDILRRESQSRWMAAGKVVYTIGGLVLSVLLGSPLPAILAAGSGALLEVAHGSIDFSSKPPDSNPVYGLWRLQSALGKDA